MPIRTAVTLVRQLADAVQHAHQHCVLHRDIKPSNILLQSDPADQLASASSDHTVRLWELDSGNVQHVMTGHEGRVVDIQFSTTGEYLLSGSVDRTIRLWRSADGQALQVQKHLDPITSVAFLGDHAQLVATDRGGSAQVWAKIADDQPAGNLAAGTRAAASAGVPLHSWKAHEGRGWKVVASPDRPGLLTAGGDGRVVYWQRPPAAQESIAIDRDDEIRDIAFERSGGGLYYVTFKDGLRLWDFASGQQVTLAEPPASRQPFARALCGLSEEVLVTALSDETLEGLELAAEPLSGGESPEGEPPTVQPRFRLHLPWDPLTPLGTVHLASSQDGRRIAYFSFDQNATLVYDVESLRLIGTFEAHAHAMALSADGTRLAMSDNNDVSVWDVDRQERVAFLRGHTSSVVAIQFSPDGRSLASGSNDRHVRLWNLAGRAEPLVFDGHRGEVESVSFSPDGRLLASGDDRGEMKLWSLPEAAELLSVAGLAPIEQLGFSPDGDRLAIQTHNRIHILNAFPRDFGPAPSP